MARGADDFSGAFYKLKGVTLAPKPVRPNLPMWIGGSTDADPTHCAHRNRLVGWRRLTS